jgi:ankyrin repeat protein
LKNTSIELVKELSVATQQFFKCVASRTYIHWSPLQIAAHQGKLELCKYILERNKNSHIRIKYNNDLANHYTHPLFMAAKKGHEGICKVLFDDLEEKNPSDILGMTTFHFAAEKGLTDVCKLIIEKVDNKNPAALNGCTPLHMAAKNGHLEIVRLIVETGVDKNSLYKKYPHFDGETPLDLAGGTLISYAFYKLLCKDETQLCDRIFNDIMCFFGCLFFMFIVLWSLLIILIFPVMGNLVPNWIHLLMVENTGQILGILSLCILVGFVSTFFLTITIALILNFKISKQTHLMKPPKPLIQ